MFDLPKLSNYGDYDSWASTFAEASARLDALRILEVLERHDV